MFVSKNYTYRMSCERFCIPHKSTYLLISVSWLGIDTYYFLHAVRVQLLSRRYQRSVALNVLCTYRSRLPSGRCPDSVRPRTVNFHTDRHHSGTLVHHHLRHAPGPSHQPSMRLPADGYRMAVRRSYGSVPIVWCQLLF